MIKQGVYKLLKTKYFGKFLFKKSSDSSSCIYFVSVDPKKVSHISFLPDSSPFLSGEDIIYGSFRGPFDLLKGLFAKDFMFKSVRQLLDGKPIISTPYFKKTRKHKNEEEAIQHVQKLEEYIELLSKQGYLSQYELGRANITSSIGHWEVPRHEIHIGMDRKGRLFRIKGGRHRLAVAQNLGIKEIPAILMLYHQNAEHLLPQKKRLITGSESDFVPFFEKEYA